jgi:two-component system chemotaxis sensor kinase CheA
MNNTFLKGGKILIVEDNFLNYQVLKILLDKLEANILWAKNGVEALAIFSQHSDILLILMDINMPEMDGITATREIRKLNAFIPIIFQTAFASDENETECRKAGGNDFLTKPINSRQLILTIRKVVRNSMPASGETN